MLLTKRLEARSLLCIGGRHRNNIELIHCGVGEVLREQALLLNFNGLGFQGEVSLRYGVELGLWAGSLFGYGIETRFGLGLIRVRAMFWLHHRTVDRGDPAP